LDKTVDDMMGFGFESIALRTVDSWNCSLGTGRSGSIIPSRLHLAGEMDGLFEFGPDGIGVAEGDRFDSSGSI
jgi:hypothetical protein